MTKEREEPVEAFEERLRAWGQRLPATLPRVAAEAVVERLPRRRLPRRPTSARTWRLVAAAAALVIALTGLLVVRHEAPPQATPTQTAALVPPLPENVVQFWLDAETPVYFVTGPQRPIPGIPGGM